MEETSITSMGFEPAFPAIERPQTYALDRTVTGIGSLKYWFYVTHTAYLHIFKPFYSFLFIPTASLCPL